MEGDFLEESGIFDLLDRRLTELATGDIDDTLESDIVTRVEDISEVGDDVFHLFTIEESESAEDLIRDSLSDEDLLKGRGLCIGPVEDSEVVS